VTFLLDAVAQSGTEIVLRVVGDGPERAALERQARTLGINGRVEWPGWVSREELPAQYRWADAFVLPSLEEGMANAVLEAFASGLAVVTTDIYGNRGLVADGEQGLLVPPADSHALAAALARLARDPDLAQALAARGRAFAESLSWPHTANGYRRQLVAATRGQQIPFEDARVPLESGAALGSEA
jgi:glycosyltransferase involved in cell wall biosynthesis